MHIFLRRAILFPNLQQISVSFRLIAFYFLVNFFSSRFPFFSLLKRTTFSVWSRFVWNNFQRNYTGKAFRVQQIQVKINLKENDSDRYHPQKKSRHEKLSYCYGVIDHGLRRVRQTAQKHIEIAELNCVYKTQAATIQQRKAMWGKRARVLKNQTGKDLRYDKTFHLICVMRLWK